MTHFYEMTLHQLEGYFEEIGENKAKAKAMFRQIYKEKKENVNQLEFTSRLKNKLAEDLDFSLPVVEKRLEQQGAEKLLLRLSDEKLIEMVLMRHPYGSGICISSQVGCGMGCKFCASGRLKKERNLTAGELIAQVVIARKLWGDITHVVIMGIGEPLDNPDIYTALEIMGCPFGLEYGPRHITLSTCGIVPGINKLTSLPRLCNLAVSLHATEDSLRSTLMPVNKKYNLSLLIPAVEEYSRLHKKKITFEYLLLKGINDSTEQANQLAQLISGVRCYVNLIPYNPSPLASFERSGEKEIMNFYDILKKNNICVTIRREYGGGINAACGQLRAELADKA